MTPDNVVFASGDRSLHLALIRFALQASTGGVVTGMGKVLVPLVRLAWAGALQEDFAKRASMAHGHARGLGINAYDLDARALLAFAQVQLARLAAFLDLQESTFQKADIRNAAGGDLFDRPVIRRDGRTRGGDRWR